jgi:hypothetical protein
MLQAMPIRCPAVSMTSSLVTQGLSGSLIYMVEKHATSPHTLGGETVRINPPISQTEDQEQELVTAAAKFPLASATLTNSDMRRSSRLAAVSK